MVVVGRRRLLFPYTKVTPRPANGDHVRTAYVDPQLAREGFTFVLASGKEGAVHADHVLEYNNDPATLRDLVLYKLTLEAQKKLKQSPLSAGKSLRCPTLRTAENRGVCLRRPPARQILGVR